MGFKEKAKFVINNPSILIKYYQLKQELRENKRLGKYNFILQCDDAGHFPHLEPYYKVFKNEPNVEIYFSGRRYHNGTRKYLLDHGIASKRIIKHVELVKHTEWDIYMNPTSWGGIFPKNKNCPRIQIFHTLADKNLHYGKSLRDFNVIFVKGPIHHDFLNKYCFGAFQETKTYSKTYNVGHAKIDDLFRNIYSKEALKKQLNISEDDQRKIIIYAPNWERMSALHRYGREVFDILQNSDHITLIKLHYMSLLSPDNLYATGGVDWNELLNRYKNVENMRIIYNQNINHYLFLADLMITDYGGAALEYICTGKPIIYLDCPEFFEERGTDIIEYWSRDTGHTVSNIKDIPTAIDTALCYDENKLKLRKELVKKLLYNPGNGAEMGKQIILNHILKEIQ